MSILIMPTHTLNKDKLLWRPDSEMLRRPLEFLPPNYDSGSPFYTRRVYTPCCTSDTPPKFDTEIKVYSVTSRDWRYGQGCGGAMIYSVINPHCAGVVYPSLYGWERLWCLFMVVKLARSMTMCEMDNSQMSRYHSDGEYWVSLTKIFFDIACTVKLSWLS